MPGSRFRRRLALLLIVIAAAALRFWGLGSGIPNDLNIDEPQIMSRSVQMMKTGDLNPHFFDYPGLYLHLQLGVACVRFLYGATHGEWTSLDAAGMEDFFLWGRAVTALFGTATVLLVFLVGRRWGTTEALLAAALMAVMPSHVRESHFVLTDVPTTFFVTLALLLTLRARESARMQAFALAAAASGLAAATKYNGGLVVIVPLLAAVMPTAADAAHVARSTLSLRRVAVVVLCSAGAFLAAAPYTVLALPEFLNGFAHLAEAYRPRSPTAESGAVIYLKHLRLNLGTTAAVLALAGLVWSAVSAVRDRFTGRAVFVAVFPLAYLWTISDKGLIFARYLLPLVPFVCLLAGIGIARIAALAGVLFRSPRAGSALAGGIAAAALFQPALRSVGFDRAISVIGTPRLAYEWIAANVPRGASVAVEAGALTLPVQRYLVQQIPRLGERPPAEIFACYDFIVASSLAYAEVLREGRGAEHTAYADLFLKGQPAATFQPSAEHPGPELKIVRMAPNPARPSPCP